MTRVALSISCALLVAACDQLASTDAPAPSVDEAMENTIASFAFGTLGDRPCRRNRITGGSNDEPTDEFRTEGRALAEWAIENIDNHPETYTLVSSDDRFNRILNQFSHMENGQPLELSTFHSSNVLPHASGPSTISNYGTEYAWVSYCNWVPSHVEVLSTTGSAESNWIGAQLRLVWKRTALGQLALNTAPGRMETDAGETATGIEEPIVTVELTRAAGSSDWNIRVDR